jgi:hypothetical protein
MNIDAIQAFLATMFETKKVRIREVESGVLVEPIAETISDEEYNCPLLGIAADSTLTVDKFLEMKREERELEYEREQRLFS